MSKVTGGLRAGHCGGESSASKRFSLQVSIAFLKIHPQLLAQQQNDLSQRYLAAGFVYNDETTFIGTTNDFDKQDLICSGWIKAQK